MADDDSARASAPRITRVVLVSNVPTPYRAPALRALAAMPGIHLHVIYCAPPHIDKTIDAKFEGYESHFLSGRYFVFERRFMHDDFSIVKLLKRLRPDVVVTTGYIPTFLYAFGWAWLTGVKHVVMTDGTLESERPLSIVHRLVRRFVFKRSAAFVGACEGSIDLFRAYGLPADALFKAPLAICNEMYRREEHAARPIDLMFCGRMVDHKRPLFALEVAAGAARALGRKVSIDFAGSGVRLEAVRERAAALSDLIVARFHGHVTQTELPGLYGNAKIFLFPSEWDPWGVVGNEAAASGMPIIVSPYAGVAGELVRDGRNGYVVPLDESAWVEASVRLLKDEHLRAEMGRAAVAAVGDFTFKAAAEGMAAATRYALGEREAIRRRIVVASLMRSQGTTGVQTHMNAFAAAMARQGRPVEMASPFDAPRPLLYGLLGLRRVLEKVSRPAAVWLYRAGHGLLLRMALRRRFAQMPACQVYAQCPVSADAALRVRGERDIAVTLVVHFNVSQADEWAEKGMLDRHGPMVHAIRGFERNVLPKVDGLVFVSQFMREQVAACIPEAAAVRRAVIPNFVATPVAEPGALMADLIAIGTLEPRKNQGYLLEVLAAANRAGARLTLTLVGDGPDRAMLAQRAVELGVESQVHFAGFVRGAARLVARHRACVHVATIENMPLTLVEALALGRPVFAVPAGGVGEVFEDGIEGRYLPANDAAAAATILCNSLADASLMAALGAAALVRHRNRFEADAVAARLEEFIGSSRRSVAHATARKTVLFVQRRMLHYRVPFFNRLRDELATAGVDLRVAYSVPRNPGLRQNADEAPLEWGQVAYKKRWLGDRLIWQDIRYSLRDVDLVILMQENRMLFNYLIPVFYPRVKWAFFGHGRNFQASNGVSPKEWFKSWYSARPDWWFAYTARSRDVVARSGFPEARITVVNNSLDDEGLRQDLEHASDHAVAARSAEWGLGEGPVGLMLGTLYGPKRLGFMLEAAPQIRALLPGFQLLIVGDGPQREVVRQAAEASGGWIVWTGALKGKDKAIALRRAAVLLNPGMVGLGIVDSFVAGLPMVTCDIANHSPEIAYLRHGENGLMVADSTAAFAEAASALMKDPARLAAMRAACLRDAQVYTLQAMVDRFAGGVRECLADPVAEAVRV